MKGNRINQAWRRFVSLSGLRLMECDRLRMKDIDRGQAAARVRLPLDQVFSINETGARHKVGCGVESCHATK